MENRNNFFHDKRLSDRPSKQRFGHYVLIPGLPIFPTRHPGVDDAPHPTFTISYDHLELLRLGEATVQTLLKAKEKVCPRIIFLSYQENNMALYGAHLLSTYMASIQAEKQFSFTLHIAGHGDPEKIGSLDSKVRLSMDVFVPMLATLLEDIRDDDIHIVFHTCNSAYCDINEKMYQEEIEGIIRKDTLIGKFINKMRQLGFYNLTVTGYRGYYAHMANHTGSLVANDFHDPTVEMLAYKAAVTIDSDGNVQLSDFPEGRFFQVHFASRSNEPEEDGPTLPLPEENPRRLRKG